MLTRNNILKITMNGEADRVICLVCKDSMVIPFPYREQVAVVDERTVRLKTRKDFLKMFLERHYGLHKRQGVK